jgi:tetratricopeptide (TPR) repeat protein
MNKIRLLLPLTLLALSATTCRTAAAQVGPQCGAIELIQTEDQYNRLVCDGIRAMADGNQSQAVDSFEKALGIQLFEYPNFVLLPRLALAYWSAGRVEDAYATLEKARLTLLVLVGIYRCQERESDWTYQLVDASGQLVRERYAEEINSLMCGAAYVDIYALDEWRSLESFVVDGQLVDHYLRIRAIIGEP